MFLFREATLADEDAIFDLARYLNTLNLPPERGVIRALLERSVASFGGDGAFDGARRFLFVLEDGDGRVVGTSMIHAQHGTPDDPHVYFTVTEEERLGRLPGDRTVHMVHTMLYLSQTYDGPTELGGLVLHPDLRGHPERLGRLLSLARFVFIAAFREWIRDRLLAELLPPLYRGPEGVTTSPLWDALGRKFTGLSYDEADKLSRTDKDFIWELFPRMPVHASLLPDGVRDIVGKVGPNTIAALRLLESVGFKYVWRVDPFDGGPHVEADTDDVTLVRDARWHRAVAGDPGAHAVPTVVALRAASAPHFRAVWTATDRGRGGEELSDPADAALASDEAMAPTPLVVPPPALARLGVAADEPFVIAAVRPQRRRADLRPRRPPVG
jgi:arginine N-succinyltransferase